MKKLFLLVVILTIVFISFSQSKRIFSENTPGEIIWYHYVTGLAVRTSDPVLTSDENIIWVKYKWAGIPSSEIFCFNPEGDTIWSKQFSERFELSPMVIPQLDWIIIGSSTNENYLYCLNHDGTVRWNTAMSAKLTQSPVVDNSFNIYVAAGTKLISFDSTGVFRWEYNSTVGEITTPLSVSKEGVIYFGTEWHKLIAVQNTSNEIFVSDLFGYTRGAPSIDVDGTIYMSTSDVSINKSKIEVFNSDGSFVWEMLFNEPNPSAIMIGDSNFIYVRTMNFWGGGFGKLYKIDKIDQSIIWDFPYGPNVSGVWDPSLSEDGTIYMTTTRFMYENTGRYYAIDSNGNVTWELDPMSDTGKEMDPMSHMLIGANGNIYSISKNDTDTVYLIAIEEPSAIIGSSAWPMHKHDQYYSSFADNIVFPQPNIFVDKTLIEFGFIEPGNSSNDQLTVYNIGNLSLELDWLLESDVFNMEIIREKGTYITETIEPGDSIVFNITFSPVDTAMFSDTIFFISNDLDQPIVEVVLEGKSTIEGEIKWMIQLSSSSLSAPAVDDLGNIYVSSFYKVWRIQPSGEIKWEYEHENESSRSYYANISISHDNQFIYLPSGTTIVSLDSSGTHKWFFNPSAYDQLYSIAINEVGELFFSESSNYGGGYLYCIDASGNEIWKYYSGYSQVSPPAIELNGNIITAGNLGNQGKVFSLDNSGNLNWQWDFMPTSQVSIGFENMIYVGGVWGNLGNYTPKVRSYKQNGILNWEFPLSNESATITSSIISHPNKTLVFASSDFYYDNGAISSLDTAGNFLWEKLFDCKIYSTPAIADNGLIYFSCLDGNFCALNPDGSERWTLYTGDELSTSPVIDNNGIIYFTTNDGFLYAVYGENGGLANSPWPMVQHDPKHTSSVDTLSIFINEEKMPSVGPMELFAMPNPFNDITIIQWTLSHATETKIMIYDYLGNEINSQELYCEKGVNQFVWDSRGFKSGVYIFNLLTSDYYLTIKLIKR